MGDFRGGEEFKCALWDPEATTQREQVRLERLYFLSLFNDADLKNGLLGRAISHSHHQPLPYGLFVTHNNLDGSE